MAAVRPECAIGRSASVRRALLRDGLYGAVYGLATGLLLLPLNFYRRYWREHSYGMSAQTAV